MYASFLDWNLWQFMAAVLLVVILWKAATS